MNCTGSVVMTKSMEMENRARMRSPVATPTSSPSSVTRIQPSSQSTW